MSYSKDEYKKIIKAEREYDRIHNEGGEGYNPLRAKRQMVEFEETKKQAEEFSLTPKGRIEALQRRIHLECGSVARDCGDREAIDALASVLYAQIEEIRAEMNAGFAAEWTKDVTATRRAEWNARVNAGEFGKPGGGRVDFKALAAREKAQGWTLDQLKKAIALHK